jgi:hypothetical protein|tara:strand:+ start:483 stop:1058 length:576 start_codon:yes stop_codon:yes gene_type:complete
MLNKQSLFAYILIIHTGVIIIIAKSWLSHDLYSKSSSQVYSPYKLDECRYIKNTLFKSIMKKGENVYNQICFHYHGTKGDGGGKVAKYMTTKPRDFKYGKFKFKSTIPGSPPLLTDIFRTITNGIQEYGMPSFYHLSQEERWGLVYYILDFDTTARDFSEFQKIEEIKKPKKRSNSIKTGEISFTNFDREL